MKNWVKIGLAVLAVLSLGFAVLLSSPADAMMPKYERLVAMGVVDEIATPHELGLDYLEREPIELAGTPELMNSIRYVNEQFAQMPENISLAVPLGTNSPVRMGDIRLDDGSPRVVTNCILEGYIGNSGQPQSITPVLGKIMTAIEYQNRGDIVMTPEAQYIVMADTKGLLAQNRRVPTLTLIVRDRRNNRRFIVYDANANAVCRDLLNGVLNRTIRRL